MLSFLSFMQKLSAYHALKKESILYPDSPIFHVQNNLPVRLLSNSKRQPKYTLDHFAERHR